MDLNPICSNHRFRSRSLTAGFRALSATLTLLIAGSASTLAQGLVEQILGTSTSSISSLSLNDKGWATWTSGHSDASQLYLWNGSGVSTLGFDGRNNRDARINNNNWIVWSAYKDGSFGTDVFLSKGGGAAQNLTSDLDTASQPFINNRNQVVFGGQAGGSGIDDIFYWSPSTKMVSDLSQYDAEGASYEPLINDKGKITWSRATEVNDGGEINLVTSSLSKLLSVKDFDGYPAAFRAITDRADLNLINGALNNTGKMVWVEYNDAKGKYDIWQYDPKEGVARNLTEDLDGDSMNPVLNDAGMVAWYTSDKHHKHYTLYWDQGGGTEAIPVASTYSSFPLALNNTGGLLYATGDGTSTGYEVILAQSPQDVPEPGTLALAGVLVTGGLLCVQRKVRRR